MSKITLKDTVHIADGLDILYKTRNGKTLISTVKTSKRMMMKIFNYIPNVSSPGGFDSNFGWSGTLAYNMDGRVFMSQAYYDAQDDRSEIDIVKKIGHLDDHPEYLL